MKVTDIDDKLARKIAEENNLKYHLSCYVIFRKKDDIEELFCIAGSDIIDALNIETDMNSKNDGYVYYRSDEVVQFE